MHTVSITQTWPCEDKVCKDTWYIHGEVQIHFHAFFDCPSYLTLFSHDFTFWIQKPMLSDYAHGQRSGRSQQTATNQGKYYMLAPKIGQLYSLGDQKPHVHFEVPAMYVHKLWILNKVTDDVAKSEYLKCKINCKQNIDNLEYVCKLSKEHELTVRMAKVTAELKTSQLKSIYVREVEEIWDPQFWTTQERYKFLVLAGKSCTGKTRYIMNRFPTGDVLELNCRNCDEPDLRKADNYKVILLDECRLTSVLAIKKVIQAGNSICSLASTQSQMYAYSIYVHAKRFVICSNTWTDELAKLAKHDPAEAQWILDNQVLVIVDRPLYIVS
jgi:hypothetical protein